MLGWAILSFKNYETHRKAIKAPRGERKKTTGQWMEMQGNSCILASARFRLLRRPAITDIKHDQVQDRFDLDALHGPATTCSQIGC